MASKATAEPLTNIDATVTIHADAPGTKISPDLFGIFFEDINYAADGGLYAELIQNRSFEYTSRDNKKWDSLTAWELVQRDGGKGSVVVATHTPLNPRNPHYAVLTVESVGAALANSGFDGIALKAGEKYDVSLFAKVISGNPGTISVRLESRSGGLLGEAKFSDLKGEWSKFTASVAALDSDPTARLVIVPSGVGSIGLDMVSLFPQKTFHNRPNGLRSDLAQVIGDLKPKFVRFPGGCLTHGDGLDNMYRWKDTIGPVEQRREQPDIWRYHQTVGLGYFEYFQFCEDIGAKALPILPAGVCCQNSGAYENGKWGQGQAGLPMSEMPAYIQEVLDLIEYANGPADSTWGAKRAAAGHPAPFNLEYLGVGNEDAQTPMFGVRFKMIYEAVKAAHPEITVVGTVGPSPSGSDFNEGWKFANDLHVDMVDEHYYERPEWFLANNQRYDSYNRAGTKVYVGEYASKGNSLFNALAEAAYMTALERNGDIVHMASYAPLLGKEQHMQWQPNLIYFDNTKICPSVNYYVQQLFSANQGDVYLPSTVSSPSADNGRSGFLLGTWDTQAEFAEVKVTGGSQTLLDGVFAESAKNWIAESGQWSVANGAYTQSVDGQPAVSRLITMIAQPNYTLTLKARKTGGKEGFLVGFGAADSKNYYWWNLGGWDNTEHAVERFVNGDKQTVGKSVAGKIELNRWYNIKVEVAGAHIKCYLDGKLVHDLTDGGNAKPVDLAVSSIQDTQTGDIIVKMVNVAGTAKSLRIDLSGAKSVSPTAIKTVLTGAATAVNTFENGNGIAPVTSEIPVGNSFDYKCPANSLTVIRVKTR